MSLNKIADLNYLDYDLLLQNDRIGIGARLNISDPYVKPMTQTDKSLVDEYNQQFQTGYEKDGKKYLYDTIEPPELDEYEPEEEYYEKGFTDKQLTKIKEEQENLNNELHEIDSEIRMIIQDINSGPPKEHKIEHLRKTENYREKIYKKIQNIQGKISQIEEIKTQDTQIRNNNKALKYRIDKSNKEKLQKYNNEMAIINSGKFNLEQQPNEDNDHFLQRLKSNSEIEVPDANLENAKLQTMIKFKDKMKEIIRSEWKIESVISRIDRFNFVDNRLFLLKRWELFKTSFIKLFGVNNPNVEVNDIVAFMNSFIDGNGNIDDNTIKQFRKEEKTVSASPVKLMSIDLFNKMKKQDMMNYLNENNIGYIEEGAKQDYLKRVYSKYFYKDDVYRPQKTPSSTPSKTPLKSGTGIIHENIPEHSHFGNVILLLKKLYFKNILSVKYPSLLSISTFKNVKVSDKFVNIIMNMIEKHYPSLHDLSLLSSIEKQIFDRLIAIGGINKHLSHNTNDKTVQQLKHRLKLIENEIEAGNDNHELKKELSVILHSLKDFGVIEHKQIKDYLNQI